MSRIDWKYIVMLIATIAGVVVALWLWRIDHHKSLTVSVISQLALRPVEKNTLPELDITVDSKPIRNPYLSLVQISNDGNQPVLTSDFDGPIEIAVSNETQVIRARVTSTIPQNIGLDFAHEKQLISIKPKLFNPLDSITISIITSGGPPTFSAKARVIGISSILVQDSAKPQASVAKRLLLGFAAILFALSAMAINKDFHTVVFNKKKFIEIDWKLAAVILTVNGVTAMVCLSALLDELGSGYSSFAVVFVFVLFAATSYLASALSRPAKLQTVAPGESKPPSPVSNPTVSVSRQTTIPTPLIEHLSSPDQVRRYVAEEEKKLPILEFDFQKIVARFVGCNVDWELEVDGLETLSDGAVKILCSANKGLVLVDSGPLLFSENPDVRMLTKKSKVRLIGSIASMPAAYRICLCNAKVVSLSESDKTSE